MRINYFKILAVSLLILCTPHLVNSELIGFSGTTDSIYSIDPSTGTATFIAFADADYAGVGLTFLGGKLFASDLLFRIGDPWIVQTARIDISTVVGIPTGISTAISNQDGSLNWHSLASNESAGLLYTIDVDDNYKLKSMTADGTITSIGSGTGIFAGCMAYDDFNGILYAATNREDGNLYSVNTITGDATLIGSLEIDSHSCGLAYDESDGILYLTITPRGPEDRSPLFKVNTITGKASLIGPTNIENIDGLAWHPIAVSPHRGMPWIPLLLLND